MRGEEKEIVKLSVVRPCYKEEKTLAKCVERVLNISNELLQLEIIIIDDFSTDGSFSIAGDLAKKDSRIIALKHDKN